MNKIIQQYILGTTAALALSCSAPQTIEQYPTTNQERKQTAFQNMETLLDYYCDKMTIDQNGFSCNRGVANFQWDEILKVECKTLPEAYFEWNVVITGKYDTASIFTRIHRWSDGQTECNKLAEAFNIYLSERKK